VTGSNRQRKHTRAFLFRGALVIGFLLGVLLLVETVEVYRYVEGDLIREEAEREADRRATSIGRTARLATVEQSSNLGPLLCEMAQENPNQIAWIRILATDGHTIAASGGGGEGPSYSASALRTLADLGRAREWTAASGPVLVVLSPLRLRSAGDRSRSPASGATEFLEVALHRKGISINFRPLRKGLIVGVSASLALLATVVVIRLRFGDYVRGKQMEKEVAIARQVQLDLLPAGNSAPGDVEFAARCIPVWEVGGDLYDVFKTEDSETVFVLGDVSGKGLSAALLMGLVQGAVRASSTGDAPLRCQQVAGQLNRLLCEKTARERFVTLFCCSFDGITGTLRYVNAGHCPPLLLRGQDRVLRLDVGGPVLGMLAAAHYESGEVMVEAGDLLVVYSDGIVEASDTQDQEFGEDRLITAIRRNWRRPPAEICESILASTKAFLGGEAPQDDQTLLIVRLEPQAAMTTTARFGSKDALSRVQ